MWVIRRSYARQSVGIGEPPSGDGSYIKIENALRWVVTARMKRVTFGNSSNGAPRTSYRSVFANHLNRVLAAGWREATTRSNQWADADLVEPNQSNQNRDDDSAEHNGFSLSLLSTSPCVPRKGARFRA
jgi:hypothetical protein